MKLSEVVNRINGNVDRFTTDLKYYIGGEHFDSDELVVSKRGTIKDNLGKLGFKFHFAFQDRDVIFMARNPHLRKAGMVRFSGLCSDASYILRSKEENVISQEFLAILLQSDTFWDYCESHKVGSVNFANNWSTIANYEFNLPTPEFQRELSEKVWAAYEVKQSYLKMIAATEEMVKSQFIEMFGNPVTNNKGWNTLPIKDVAPEAPSLEKQTGKVWILNLDMIESNTGKVVEKVFENDSNLLSVAPFDEGNVLYSKLRPYLNKVVIPDGKGYATTELVPLRPNQKLLNLTFFSHLLRGDDFVTYANSISTGTKMPRMPLNDLRKFQCILPPIEKQNKFEEIARQADKSISELRKSVDAIDKVIKSLINENL